MTKLTDNQTLILKHAAGYVDGAVLPLPDGLHLSAGALNGALGALRLKGLVQKDDNGEWRVTDAGRAAVGAAPVAADGKLATLSARPHSKQARLVELLRRPEGATIADVQAETDWQAHSIRGAISGVCKKKLGLAVASAVEEGRGRVYRIVSGG